MSSLNSVIIMGNLTRDPEVRFTPKGTAVGDLSLAINETYKTAEGEKKEEVTFVDVVVWGRQAETCKEYLTKGSPVLISGRLQLDTWEGKDGEKKSRMRVRADRVQFLGSGKKREDTEDDDKRYDGRKDRNSQPDDDNSGPRGDGCPF